MYPSFVNIKTFNRYLNCNPLHIIGWLSANTQETHVTGEVSLGFSGEYGERVQTQLEALLPLLLPVALVHFLREGGRNYQKPLHGWKPQMVKMVFEFNYIYNCLLTACSSLLKR